MAVGKSGDMVGPVGVDGGAGGMEGLWVVC